MRELRNRDPEIFRLITIRTVGGRLWLTPNSRMKALTGGIIARYQEKFSIEIFAYAVLGNHPHLLIRAPRSNTDEFCENVNREIARRVNWLHRREGPFWARRYVDQEVVSEEDLLEAFLYVTTNPSGHGLVADSATWPGLNCVKHVISGKDRKFRFYQYSNPEQPVVEHRLRISILPQFENLRPSKRKATIAKLIQERHEQIIEQRGKDGFLGLEAIRQQEAGARPQRVKKTPRAPFYTKCFETILELKARVRARREAYDWASFRYRLGDTSVEFPLHSYKPPLHRRPRIVPFAPLSALPV